MKCKEAYLLCGLKFYYCPKYENRLSLHDLGILTATMRTMLPSF